MFRPAVVLDASMRVPEVFSRLARHGLWLDPEQSEAKAYIQECARLFNGTPEEVECTSPSPADGAGKTFFPDASFDEYLRAPSCFFWC